MKQELLDNFTSVLVDRHQNWGGPLGERAPPNISTFQLCATPTLHIDILAVSASSKLRHPLFKQTKLNFDATTQSDPLRPPIRHHHFIVSPHAPSEWGMSTRLVCQQWQSFQYHNEGWLQQIHAAIMYTRTLDLSQSICSCTESKSCLPKKKLSPRVCHRSP